MILKAGILSKEKPSEVEFSDYYRHISFYYKIEKEWIIRPLFSRNIVVI